MRNIEGSEAKFKMKRMLENEKALGNKISASIIMRHIGNINAWGGDKVSVSRCKTPSLCMELA